jgi:hypothetical protein
MNQHSMTRPAGTISQSRNFFVCTDEERDQFVLAAYASDVAGVITRPSGESTSLGESAGRGQAAGWNQQQQAAARRLQTYWQKALPLRGLPAGHAGGGKSAGELSEDQAAECQIAWDLYCDAMAAVKARCSAKHEHWVRQVVVYRDPSPLYAAHLVREALSWLASEWGIDERGRDRR